jgi:hypothetical protein
MAMPRPMRAKLTYLGIPNPKRRLVGWREPQHRLNWVTFQQLAAHLGDVDASLRQSDRGRLGGQPQLEGPPRVTCTPWRKAFGIVSICCRAWGKSGEGSKDEHQDVDLSHHGPPSPRGRPHLFVFGESAISSVSGLRAIGRSGRSASTHRRGDRWRRSATRRAPRARDGDLRLERELKCRITDLDHGRNVPR